MTYKFLITYRLPGRVLDIPMETIIFATDLESAVKWAVLVIKYTQGFEAVEILKAEKL